MQYAVMSESFHFVYVQLRELFHSHTSVQTVDTPFIILLRTKPLCGDGNLNLDTGLDVDDDLLDDLSGSVEVDEACSHC